VQSSRAAVAAVAVAGFVAAFGLWLGLLALREARAGDGFDFARWELTTVANKWLFALGAPLRDDPPAEPALARYFALEDRGGDEGERLENAVEAALEGRIDAAIRDAGLSFPLPLPGPLAVWPPVDLELSGSPRVLVVSPRAEIRRVVDLPLRLDLDRDELLALEAETEREDESVSALIVATGGVATYPAIVSDSRSYRSTVSTATHEWVHHHLAFYPLGRAFFDSPDARTINETVAAVAGDELRDLVLARYGEPSPPEEVDESGEEAPVDRAEVLRELRLEVDELLAAGEIAAAERRMEEVRRFLEDNGVFIRRINQAHFAWFGTYAARADATDPLGPQIFEIRERAGSLRRFLELVRGQTSRADIEELLAEMQAGTRS
jgi:hypothetical protein